MQARRAFERFPEAATQREEAASPRDRESIGELLGHLANNSAALVRDELTLAKREMSEKLDSFKDGVIVLAIGAVVGLMALLTLCAAVVIGLAQWVGAWQSALIIGGLLAVGAGVLALVGIGRLKRTSLKPEQTIETLEEDKEWLKELT